jgi:hypothetical protein
MRELAFTLNPPNRMKDEERLDRRLLFSSAASLYLCADSAFRSPFVQDGEPYDARAFGQADIAAGRVAEPSTRYAVGSISQQFTAAACSSNKTVVLRPN